MSEIFNFSATREPDFTLNSPGTPRGWTLLPSTLLSLNSVSVNSPEAVEAISPASFLLSDDLISRITPLKKWSSKFVQTDPTKIEDVIDDEIQISQFHQVLKFDSFYNELHQAYLAKNAQLIEEIASRYINDKPVKSFIELDTITQSIYRFFTQKGCKATQEELLRFFGTIPEKDLLVYLRNLHTLIDEIKCQILASHVLGQLGQYKYNLIDVLRSVLAFITLALLVYGEDRIKNFPIKYICTILDLNVYLPDWTYDIDPCKWVLDDRDDADIKVSPLAKRITEKVAYLDELQQIKADRVAREDSVKNLTVDDGKTPHPHPDCNPVVVEPGEHNCDCTEDCKPKCLPQDPCCAEIIYYVTDLMVLREETTCYKPSDLAYIENVAPKETRSRKHSFIKTIEDFTEEETTKSRSEERDHQVTERFNLQKEIENQIDQSLDVEAEVSGVGYSVTTNASLSKEVAQREARETFRESVNKAVLKIQTETRKLQSRRVTTEESEKNKHKFKNDTNDPLVTKYFWVSQEKKAQVYSYGLRGTVELLIPSPALLYEHLEKLKAEQAFDLKKPKHPCLKLEDIVREKYNDYVVEYGLYDLPKPPEQPPVKYINVTARHNVGSIQINIPASYTAVLLERTGSVLHRRRFWGGFARLSFIFGGHKVEHSTNGTIDSAQILERNSGSAIVQPVDVRDSSISVKITLNPDEVDLSEWQLTVFKNIMEKYDEEIRKYEEALAEHNRRQQDKLIQGRHPFAAEEIMRAEIKRAAIYMMCDEFDSKDVMNLKSEPCGHPEINRPQADEKTWDWYFFDRAFDWRLMSFKFFDYFRNPKCSWPDKFDPNDPNFMFNAFLRAGYVRVQIPVTPAMDEDVLWYINTKEKWGPGGTIPQNPSDPRWLSIIDEIKHSYDVYQNDREGLITAIIDTASNNENTNQVLITGTDRYWDELLGIINQDAINLDLNREIFIDSIAYRVINIELDPSSPPYSTTSGSDMQWIVSLNRVFEGEAFADSTTSVLKKYNYAIGAKFIGAPFRFELPTNLIWVGDHDNKCLPCYPIDC